jgi:hypothetical protein
MADAEDLKSSGDFSSCGFDSHPGHHYIVNVYAVVSWPIFRCDLYVTNFFELGPLLAFGVPARIERNAFGNRQFPVTQQETNGFQRYSA